MSLQSRWAKAALMLAVLAMLATGCRSDGDVAEDAQDAVDQAASDAADAADDAADAVDEAASDAADAADEAMDDADEAMDDAMGDIATGQGITEEACPEGVNPDNGCIYLGVISDLTVGPFVALSVPITDAQAAFWARVNDNGGIGGYDVNVTEYTRDNQYNPEVHSQQYEEIKGDILAIAQTLGSPTTAAIIDDLNAENIVAVPASWTSAWLFEDIIIESGNVYCIETMNGLDYMAAEADITSIMAVHYPGDYGDDGAAGAEYWAEQHGAEFIDVPTVPGADNQGEAIGAVVQQAPDVVVLTTAPTEAGTIIGTAAAQGFTGRFMTNGPGWNKGLLDSAAAEAIQGLLTIAGPWAPFNSDTPGHNAMRDALGDVDPNEGYTSGWIWSYPLLAVLEQAASNGDLTREGLISAVGEVTEVDYEGMLPSGAGNLSGDADGAALRATVISRPDPADETGAVVVDGGLFYEGETAAGFTFDGPCFG